MHLYITISTWGDRKSCMQSGGGIYQLDLSTGRMLHQAALPVLPGATKAFSGLTYDDSTLYVAQMLNSFQDTILKIDRKTFKLIGGLTTQDLHDVHQVDVWEDSLWAVNSNYNEVVVFQKNTGEILGRTKVFDPNLPEEKCLMTSYPRKFGDHRLRCHLNSIHIQRGLVYLGHFGADRGDFNSPQLTRIPWRRERSGKITFDHPEHVSVSGFASPHNLRFDSTGMRIGCHSAAGKLIWGDQTVELGGWTRRLAYNEESIFVGVSSYCYSEPDAYEKS